MNSTATDTETRRPQEGEPPRRRQGAGNAPAIADAGKRHQSSAEGARSESRNDAQVTVNGRSLASSALVVDYNAKHATLTPAWSRYLALCHAKSQTAKGSALNRSLARRCERTIQTLEATILDLRRKEVAA